MFLFHFICAFFSFLRLVFFFFGRKLPLPQRIPSYFCMAGLPWKDGRPRFMALVPASWIPTLVKDSERRAAMCHNEQSASLQSRLELSHEPQSKPNAESNGVCAEQAERRIKRSLNYAEAKPALAAEQQQYAPSFSLSAPCILLTLTHRLRFVSNPYFDTPSESHLIFDDNQR